MLQAHKIKFNVMFILLVYQTNGCKKLKIGYLNKLYCFLDSKKCKMNTNKAAFIRMHSSVFHYTFVNFNPNIMYFIYKLVILQIPFKILNLYCILFYDYIIVVEYGNNICIV